MAKLPPPPTTLPIKVYDDGGSVWRSSIGVDGPIPLSRLLGAVGALVAKHRFNALEWIDEDGDRIGLYCDADVVEVVRCRPAPNAPLKLRAITRRRSSMTDAAVHRAAMAEIVQKRSAPHAKPAERGLARYDQRRAAAADAQARVDAIRAADTDATQMAFADRDVYTRMLAVGVPALAVVAKMRADILSYGQCTVLSLSKRRFVPAAQPARAQGGRAALLAEIRRGTQLQNVATHAAPPLAGQYRHALQKQINSAIETRVPKATVTAPAGFDPVYKHRYATVQRSVAKSLAASGRTTV